MSDSLKHFLQARLADTNARNLYRRRRVVEGAHGVQARVDGADLTLFCSNDYLGLATHPALMAAMAKAAHAQGVGSGASQLITGHNQAHQALERELAEYLQRERALLLSSGYLANVGVISALMGREDHIFSDALNHASLIDGIRLSRAKVLRYPHADLAVLQDELRQHQAAHRLIVSDAVFSMDGDVADLPGLSRLAAEHDAWLMVDDAHGLGVLGPQGRGAVAAAGLDAEAVPVLTATLGKSLGAAGAFVAGGADLIEALIQSTRTFIFSTALPPAVAEAARVGLRLSRDEQWRRDKLFELIAYFREGAAQRGLPVAGSQTAIQPLLLGEEQRALAVSEKLLAQGFLVSAIRPPTVPAGTSRLRITLSAAHERAQVTALLDALARVLL
ncbi:MAG: 8-amino-7-oxononanoate synthase [Nevskiales bacterium]